jgi:hypothetical protein
VRSAASRIVGIHGTFIGTTGLQDKGFGHGSVAGATTPFGTARLVAVMHLPV